MAFEKNIGVVLKERFPEVTGDLLDDCIRVSDKLSAGPKSRNVKSALKSLEADLHHQRQVDQGKRAMGTTLSATEKQGGINVDVWGGTASVATVNRPMTKDEGLDLMANKRIWKDPGIDPAHGEHTHRIQWNILIRQNIVKAPDKFLVDISKHPGEDGVAKALWDFLFDRLTDGTGGAFLAHGQNDFRCPEHLNAYLIGNAKDYPALSETLGRHKTKRQDMRGVDDSAALYAAMGKIIAPDEVVAFRQSFSNKLPGGLFDERNRICSEAMTYEFSKVGLTLNTGQETINSNPQLEAPELAKLLKSAMQNALRGYRLRTNVENGL